MDSDSESKERAWLISRAVASSLMSCLLYAGLVTLSLLGVVTYIAATHHEPFWIIACLWLFIPITLFCFASLIIKGAWLTITIGLITTHLLWIVSGGNIAKALIVLGMVIVTANAITGWLVHRFAATQEE